MRVLIVEDDPAMYDLVVEMANELLPGREVEVATSRDQAFSRLDQGQAPLELLVCDLKIPTTSGGVDAEESHGKSVFARFVQEHPGVPCIFLSGYASDNTQDLTDFAGGAGLVRIGPDREPVPLVQVAEKVDLISFRSRLARLAAQLQAVDDCAIGGEEALKIPEVDARVLKLSLLQHREVHNGTLSVLHGGMAAARTYRLDGLGQGGELAVQLFVKVASALEIQEEISRYRDHVPAKLRPGNYASLVAHIEALCGGQQGLVLRFGDYVKGSVFDLLQTRGADLISQIRTAVEPWESAHREVEFSVSSLRQRRLSDKRFRETGLLSRPDAVRLEGAKILGNRVVCHGDLHGDNALVSDLGVCLIDFGDVEPSLAGLDPVTLEMSLWTHKRGRDIAGGWPSVDAAARWWSLDDYLQGCPVPEFVRACREWALGAAAGREEVLVAIVYAHSLRQLKYDDVNATLAHAFIEGAIERWAQLKRR